MVIQCRQCRTEHYCISPLTYWICLLIANVPAVSLLTASSWSDINDDVTVYSPRLFVTWAEAQSELRDRDDNPLLLEGKKYIVLNWFWWILPPHATHWLATTPSSGAAVHWSDPNHFCQNWFWPSRKRSVVFYTISSVAEFIDPDLSHGSRNLATVHDQGNCVFDYFLGWDLAPFSSRNPPFVTVCINSPR
jgi:hypothetical protein